MLDLKGKRILKVYVAMTTVIFLIFIDLPVAIHAAKMMAPSRIPNTLSIRNPKMKFNRYSWHLKKCFIFCFILHSYTKIISLEK